MSVELDGANNIVKTDTISEVTSANGVTVDGLSIKDSKLVTADSVIEANMSANSVDSDSYVDGSIDTAHIAADAITGAKIADDAINSEHYTDGSIDTAHIADSQITAAKTSELAGSVVDQWRTTGNTEYSGSGRHYVTANWEQNDTTGFEYQGASMTESSGIFTFPSTGKYLVRWSPCVTNNESSTNRAMTYVMIEISGTRDNSSYAEIAKAFASNDDAGGEYYMGGVAEMFWDVTNTTNDKVKFGFYVANGVQTKGDSAKQVTGATFIKMGTT